MKMLEPELLRKSEQIYKSVKPRIKDNQLKLTDYTISENIRRTYPQDWWAYNQAQTREKLLFMIILKELSSTVPVKPSKRRGKVGLSLPEKIITLGIYSYGNFSSRRSISDLRIAHSLGLISKVPHFNSVLNFMRYDELTAIISDLIIISSLPLKHVELDFAVDASGFSTKRFERWFNVRTKTHSRKRMWKKAHLICGVKTNTITSVIITDGIRSDNPHLKPLVKKTRKYFDMREVSADKGYVSRLNLQTISDVGAMPLIPFKKNSCNKARGSLLWRKMFEYFRDNHEEFKKHYHKRSNVETVFSQIKRKFSNNLKSKNNTAQINEILVKCLCHNICVLIQESFELGINIDLHNCAETFFAQKNS